PFFVSPAPAGRRITAGFTWLQRIGKAASYDLWFPREVHETVATLLAKDRMPGPEHFPAQWAAVRQFELLQEADNISIYDLDPTHLTRALRDLTHSMRAGGYRMTVATVGAYANDAEDDDLAILDRRLQERISGLIHMLYLEEQSARANEGNAVKLCAEEWDYRTALPHIGVTLGARDLFRPAEKKRKRSKGKRDGGSGGAPFSAADRRHALAQQFFAILGLLPQNHIRHDTAIGLQLPEMTGERNWVYIVREGETFGDFTRLMDDLFAPFDGVSLGVLHGREDAGSEIKSTVTQMQGYGDRLRPEADGFYRRAAGLVANC
ncbi:MAG TPA: hypothetical protein VMV79_05740, partial [Alphaproteobacteria bacterium]|nr:hypothetical protein [Alphaproteobacteria bacterium]